MTDAPPRIHSAREPYRYECPRGHTGTSLRRHPSPHAKSPYSCTACRMAGHDDRWDAADITDKKQRERADDGGWAGP